MASGDNRLKASILLVDDDDDLREIMKDSLEYSGFSVREARDGRSAMRMLLAEGATDAVLLDIDLPDMSGHAVCRMIKEQDIYSDLPVFFISGDTGLQSRIKSFTAGGARFFSKPFRMAEIIEALMFYMARNSRIAATA